MGNVERCDKTLPLNEMIFYVRRDAGLRCGLMGLQYAASSTVADDAVLAHPAELRAEYGVHRVRHSGRSADREHSAHARHQKADRTH